MNDLAMWITIGAIGLVVLVLIVLFIIKLTKMTPEERKKLLKTYLKGAISLAEQELVGSKRGQEKLEMVEEYFNKNASWFLKIVLLITGKSNLQELIEESLGEIKDSFGK